MTSGSSAPKERISGLARELGFDAVGFAAPELDSGAQRALQAFIAQGWQGDMLWMASTEERRASPRALWPEVRSVVVLAMNYGPPEDPLALLDRPERATIAAYARGRDYHRLFKSRLKALARALNTAFAAEVKFFVDTAPVMEKPLAAKAGLGWQGKHTNLISRRYGSWLFLGEIFTTLELEPDAPEEDHCGSCRRCLDVCPTKAFPAPYRLDARRCISYLTIEHKGHIPRRFRAAMGNRIYGCDDCLAVCPWNKFASRTTEYAFLPRAELSAPMLADLARLDDPGFREVFAVSPLKRIGRDRFVRNVLIALGNSESPKAVGCVEERLGDASPLVRAMAVWALSRLVAPARFAALRESYREGEGDAEVRAEWDAITD
jgi:epoxyqueuosine reductase